MSLAHYETSDEVDFVIVGSGASGGVLAKELAVAGFRVLVLEQGPYRRSEDFGHDEWATFFDGELTNHPLWNDPQTFRVRKQDRARVPQQFPAALYARTVGGSSVHFSANYWRFRESDFRERSLFGPMDGTGFTDWPISYAELEPYYTKVEWQIGVSGAPGPFDAPRSKPFPMPPLPLKSSGALLAKGAKALGFHPQPAPLAVLSRPFNGRMGCLHCGFCMGFGCEVGAKSSTLVSMIPLAEATGMCEIRPLCTVCRIETGRSGRADKVIYLDADGIEQAQKARSVIIAANGAETPRLLLMSESAQHPDGLANSSGLVGKYLMGNSHAVTAAWFDQPLHDYKSVQVSQIVHDFYENDPGRGFYGGGGIDARPYLDATPILHALLGVPPEVPAWGGAFKNFLRHSFTHKMTLLSSTTSVPLESNNISLDPQLKDDAGRPAIRMTYLDHADDLAMARFLQERTVEILEAAGAEKIWPHEVVPGNLHAHLLGTCRMGNDPSTSVVDRDHRSHDVPNLFICDGSSFVSSGRGQPTMTIQALAFRAAEHIADAARRGDI